MCPRDAHGRMQTHSLRGGGRGVACQDAATSALQIAESASRPHAQRLKHGTKFRKLCLQTRSMSDSFRQTRQVSPKHASVTHNITRKHQIMSICTMKIEHTKCVHACDVMLSRAPNGQRNESKIASAVTGASESMNQHIRARMRRGRGQRHSAAK